MHQPLSDPRRPQQKVTVKVSGMHCTNCALSLEKHLLKVGANTPSVDYATGHTSFFVASPNAAQEIVKSIQRLGYAVTEGAHPSSSSDHHSDHSDHSHNVTLYVKATIAAVLTAPMLLAMFLPHSVLHEPWLQCILATPVFILGVLHFGNSGLRSLRAGVANMDVLICLGIVAGYLSSIISLVAGLSHEMIFFEATSSIVTFVMIGHLLEDRAVRKTTSAIESLAALQPRRAVRIILGGDTAITSSEEIDTAQIVVGDLLQVNSGDTIPTDGTLERGTLSCNEMMITGESLPVDKRSGDRVIGGAIALEGSAVIRAGAVGDDTVLASIVRLVHEAHQRKPQIQRLGDAVSAVFVPGVIIVSLIVLVGGMLFFNLSGTEALVRALAIAVVACPCAMGLATPTAIMVALGRAATSGILIRGGDTLERLSTIKQVGFDKTGTLTEGRLQVTHFETHNEASPDDARGIILTLQRSSSHPIAKALVRDFAAFPSSITFTSISETKGIGLEGIASNGDTYACGGRAVMERFSITSSADIILVRNGTLLASITLDDTIRHEAAAVVKELQALGLQASIISGDTTVKTGLVAQRVGITDVHGQQLPHQKLELIRQKQVVGPIAYVGDGINDAPTLAEASVGISLSSASDVAMHSAQIILSGNTLKNLPAAIRLARVTVRTIKQNLFWAFFYNILAIPLAALGYISPLAGALIMTGSDVIIVANSLRIKFARLSS